MTFRSVNFDSNDCGANCPQVIVADGVIEAETPQAFVDFAKQASQSQRLRSVIFMNSPGGNVVASMELGAAFRRLRAAVVVAGFASVGAALGTGRRSVPVGLRLRADGRDPAGGAAGKPARTAPDVAGGAGRERRRTRR